MYHRFPQVPIYCPEWQCTAPFFVVQNGHKSLSLDHLKVWWEARKPLIRALPCWNEHDFVCMCAEKRITHKGSPHKWASGQDATTTCIEYVMMANSVCQNLLREEKRSKWRTHLCVYVCVCVCECVCVPVVTVLVCAALLACLCVYVLFVVLVALKNKEVRIYRDRFLVNLIKMEVNPIFPT